MTVWILWLYIREYEREILVNIFSTQEKAIEFLRQEQSKYSADFFEYHIQAKEVY